MERFAVVIRRPRRSEELRGLGILRPYRIISTIRLNAVDFENFAADLLADRAFLENPSGCGEDGELVRCLCVTSRGKEAILVLPDGTGHIAMAALLHTTEK